MATLMQKDVLLEMNFFVYSCIFHAKGKVGESERKDDLIWLGAKENKYYSTDESELDYDAELNELRQMKDKYEALYG